MFYDNGFLLFIEVVVFIVLFVKIHNLRADLDAMQKGSRPVHEKKVADVPIAQSHEAPVHTTNERSWLDDAIDWVKQDFLMKFGALLILLAISWFVRYSFLNNWIGPIGRISMGMVAGAAVLGGGFVAMKKRRIPGQVLIVLGTTTLLLTTFAAREYYDFFTPGSALGIMSLVVVLTTVISIKENALALAVTSLFGGIVAPLMTASVDPNFTALSTYLLILCLGTFAVVALRGWRSLVLLATLAIGVYTGPFEIWQDLSDQMVWIFMGLFYGLLFVGGALGILHEKKVVLSDLIATVLTVFLGIYWVQSFVPIEGQSLVLSGVAVISMLISLGFKSKAMPIKSVYLHSVGAVLLLGAAAIIEFEGEIQTLVLSLEAFLFVWMAAYLLKDKHATLAAGALQLVPGVLALNTLGDTWHEMTFAEDLVTILVVASSLAATALIFWTFAENHGKDKEMQRCFVLAVVAAVFFVFGAIWRGLEFFLPEDYAHGTALVIYALTGLTLFFNGVVKQLKGIRYGGIAVLTLVLLRLILVEIWSMSLVERIITFVVIGILFMITAFFEKKSNK